MGRHDLVTKLPFLGHIR